MLHRQGRLAIQHCSLELDPAGGLAHLFAPIVTTATGAVPGGAAAAGAGILSVSETRIQVRNRMATGVGDGGTGSSALPWRGPSTTPP